MQITVTDLFDGVTPESSPVTITVVEGSASTGGGGAVDSVNSHTGVVVLDADDIADGTTNHAFTALDDTKLAGIASGATANDTDANLKARANHTGTQAISTVTGLQTALDGKDTALAAHEADTTSIHGIGNTAALETQSGAQDKADAAQAAAESTAASALSTHAADTTAVHGIADTSVLATATTLATAVSDHAADTTDVHALAGITGLQAALDAKAALASPTLTGNPTAPTPSAADNDTSIATTAFVQGEITAKAPLASPTFTGDPKAPTPSAGDNDTSIATTAFVAAALLKQQEVIGVALSDESTAITTGTAKLTMRMPFAMTLTAVRASLTVTSSSGVPTVDINEAGTTILSTKLTIDAGELTSTTAATAAVISDSSLADDAEITFDIDVAGTGAKGLKVWLIGTRT